MKNNLPHPAAWKYIYTHLGKSKHDITFRFRTCESLKKIPTARSLDWKTPATYSMKQKPATKAFATLL